MTSRTTPAAADEILRRWASELAAAKQREEQYRTDGDRILAIYDGSKSAETPFNILFSNTETLLPAIYSATPRPVVARRFKDADPLGKASAMAATRLLTYLVDTNVDGYETVDEGLTAATLNALVQGRGESRVKYDAELLDLPASSSVSEADDEDDPGMETGDYAATEVICMDSIHWARILYGYATKWSTVPWIAYEEYIEKPEAIRLFGPAMADKLVFTRDATSMDERRGQQDEKQGERKVAKIYQIWDKDGGRKVRYFSEQVKDAWLKEVDDPLQLSGFFNCPRPLQFIKKTHSLVPTAPYLVYESQANELNQLTSRIKNVAKAIKAKGVYDGGLGPDIKKLLEADDNEFVPADTPSSLAADKGFQNAIWFMPIDQLIVVLTQLYQARDACKQTIFEITGISDILRGATQASETATAQTIKNQWGTLRLKRAQKEVARYARDLLRLMLELAASKFSEETWAKMTGLPYLLQAQVQHLQMQVQAMQNQEPSPQLQQVQQQLQTPHWSQVLALLRDDLLRSYRIDIETNSTVEPEATEDQKQISELFTAIGQFLNGVGPLVAQGVMPFQVAQSMLLTITRRFRFGTEIEELIQQMQAPTPQEGEQGKAQEAALKQQQQLQLAQLQLQQQRQEMDLKAKTMDAEKALLEKKIDLELREMQLGAEQDQFAMQKESATKILSLQSQSDTQKMQTEQRVAALQHGQARTAQQTSQHVESSIVQSLKEVQQTMRQLQHAVTRMQEDSTHHTVQALVATMAAPRTKRAIRGKDGRIESVEDSLMTAPGSE